jgi:hypothetical protein
MCDTGVGDDSKNIDVDGLKKIVNKISAMVASESTNNDQDTQRKNSFGYHLENLRAAYYDQELVYKCRHQDLEDNYNRKYQELESKYNKLQADFQTRVTEHDNLLLEYMKQCDNNIELNNQVQVSTNKINILLNKELEYQKTIKELKASNELIEPLANFIKNVMVDKPINAIPAIKPYYNGPIDLPDTKPNESPVVKTFPINVIPKISKPITPPKVPTPTIVQAEPRVNVEGTLLGEYNPKKDQGSYTLGKLWLTPEQINLVPDLPNRTSNLLNNLYCTLTNDKIANVIRSEHIDNARYNFVNGYDRIYDLGYRLAYESKHKRYYFRLEDNIKPGEQWISNITGYDHWNTILSVLGMIGNGKSGVLVPK